MSRRPRLVHEGSPIVDADEHEHEHGHASNAPNGNGFHWNGRQQDISSFTERNRSSAPKTKFKLKTKLVIGEAAGTASVSAGTHRNQLDDEDSLDAMMTDDAEQHYDTFNTQPVYHQHFPNNYTHQQQHAPYPNEYRSSHAEHHDTFNTQPSYHQHPNDYTHQQQQQQQHAPYPNEYSSSQPQQEPSLTNHLHPMPSPTKSPLVVIDGANLAYAYAETLNPTISNQYQRREPNPRGITKAIQYFLQHSCRVQAVVPISWYKLKPRPGDYACTGTGSGYKGNLNQRDDAKMLTEEVEELRMLRQHGFLVACPPGDDDDAYVIALARREEERRGCCSSLEQDATEEDGMMMMDDEEPKSFLPLGGYVVSNDFYNDAIRRDAKKLKQHQQQAHLENEHHISTATSLSQQSSSSKYSLKSWLKHHRISYSFANVGLVSEQHYHGSANTIELEFLPNPRNELIEAIDAQRRLLDQGSN